MNLFGTTKNKVLFFWFAPLKLFLQLEFQSMRAERMWDFCYIFGFSDGKRERKMILDIRTAESEESAVGETQEVKKQKRMSLFFLEGNEDSGRGKHAGSRDDANQGK